MAVYGPPTSWTLSCGGSRGRLAFFWRSATPRDFSLPWARELRSRPRDVDPSSHSLSFSLSAVTRDRKEKKRQRNGFFPPDCLGDDGGYWNLCARESAADVNPHSGNFGVTEKRLQAEPVTRGERGRGRNRAPQSRIRSTYVSWSWRKLPMLWTLLLLRLLPFLPF